MSIVLSEEWAVDLAVHYTPQWDVMEYLYVVTCPKVCFLHVACLMYLRFFRVSVRCGSALLFLTWLADWDVPVCTDTSAVDKLHCRSIYPFYFAAGEIIS